MAKIKGNTYHNKALAVAQRTFEQLPERDQNLISRQAARLAVSRMPAGYPLAILAALGEWLARQEKGACQP